MSPEEQYVLDYAKVHPWPWRTEIVPFTHPRKNRRQGAPVKFGIHHSADQDGLFSREVLKHFVPGIELVGWDYGQPTPVVPEDCDTLYVVDLSVPDLMDDPRLVWIDHHKSAIEKYGARHGFQLDGVAACRLAYQWFLGNRPTLEAFRDRRVDEPLILRLVGEHDVWDHRDPRAKVLQYGLVCTEPSLALNVDRVLADGEIALRYSRAVDKRDAYRAKTIRWNGVTFCAMGFGGGFNSFNFEPALRPEHEACLGWRHDGERWRVSLYRVPGKTPDLLSIAKAMGGGGHEGACGFPATFRLIEDILTA
jgi:hypothetical protein